MCNRCLYSAASKHACQADVLNYVHVYHPERKMPYFATRFGKQASASNQDVCVSSLQAFLLKLNSAEFDSLDSMCDSLAAIESGPEYGLSEKGIHAVSADP